MKKHVNIPIFIPHYGCPNACVFCNQVRITGKPCFSESDVRREIDEALSTVDLSRTEAELAFFGGSFTAIPMNEMLSLLAISDDYINQSKISSVRLSTRPDAIDEEILCILAEHGVKTVELGIQSTAAHVLEQCKRGHTREHSERACRLIKEHGFNLVGQMMVGLPASTPEDELRTARDIASFGADGARIYPTVVLPGTALAAMEDTGEYVAMTVTEAAERCADVLEIFSDADVRVIRIGLCSNEILNKDASPLSYHAAIGELTRSLLYRKRMEKALENAVPEDVSCAVFTVASGRISQAVGQHRSNVTYLCEKFRLHSIRVKESQALKEYAVQLTSE